MSGLCLRRSSRLLHSSTLRLPLFLAPAFATHPSQNSSATSANFTSASTLQVPKKRSREKNKNRGVSAIRRTGPRVPLSVSKYPLPQPVIDRARRNQFEVNPEHGLWGFFKDATPMFTPEEEDAHGRAWTYQELSNKSWEDLHALYWVCIKERNQIHTRSRERKRLRAGYGTYESTGRLHTVKVTMKLIREVLLDRHHLREDARALMANDDVDKVLAFPEWQNESPFEWRLSEEVKMKLGELRELLLKGYTWESIDPGETSPGKSRGQLPKLYRAGEQEHSIYYKVLRSEGLIDKAPE